MLRVAIVNMTGGGISGGYKKYLINLLPRMSRHNEMEAILCASPQKLSVPSWFEEMKNVTFVNSKPFTLLGNKDIKLQKQLDEFNPDVIFVPVERYFKHRHTPTVCMLQNMLPMASVKHFNILEGLRNKIQKAITHKALKRSQRIIAISDYVSASIQHEWQIPSNKIGIVYYGVKPPGDEKLTIPAAVSPDWAGRFIFTAGSIEIFRGIEDIIHAVNKLKQHGWDMKIIIAGSARPGMISYYRKLQENINKLGLGSNVCWAGMISGKEMAWCYKNARAFIMSSRVEACPNTALEAMSYGSIIISSTAPPMEELFGKAAIYYKTGDVEKLSDCIINAYSLSSAQKDFLSQMAVWRASAFSWEDTVNKTIVELGKAIAN